MHISSLSFLGLLASIFAPTMAFEACLTNPPPRKMPASLLEQCAPDIRTKLSADSITRTSIQHITNILGESSRPAGFYNLPCGGIPPDASNKCVTTPGASLPVKWITINKDQEVDAAACQCQVSLHNPGTGQAERVLWSGSCGEQERSVKIPNDADTCMFGDCFLQWKMETGRETYVNCADLVIHASQESASHKEAKILAGEQESTDAVQEVANTHQQEGGYQITLPPNRDTPPTPPPAHEKPVYFNGPQEDRKEPVSTATVIYSGQPTGTAPAAGVPCPQEPTTAPFPSPPMGGGNPADCDTPMGPGMPGIPSPGFGGDGPGMGYGPGFGGGGPGMGFGPGFGGGRPGMGFGPGFGGGRPIMGPGMGGPGMGGPGFGDVGQPGAGIGGPFSGAPDADCYQ